MRPLYILLLRYEFFCLAPPSRIFRTQYLFFWLLKWILGGRNVVQASQLMGLTQYHLILGKGHKFSSKYTQFSLGLNEIYVVNSNHSLMCRLSFKYL